MAKHEPSPWTLGPRTDDLAPGTISIDSANHKCLAMVVYEMEDDVGHTDDYAGSDVCRANAKLIAAAPELLEAVKRLMIIHCPLTGAPTPDELVEHWEYEKSEGNGAADDMLFVLSVVKKATE